MREYHIWYRKNALNNACGDFVLLHNKQYSLSGSVKAICLADLSTLFKDAKTIHENMMHQRDFKIGDVVEDRSYNTFYMYSEFGMWSKIDALTPKDLVLVDFNNEIVGG